MKAYFDKQTACDGVSHGKLKGSLDGVAKKTDKIPCLDSQ
jgi:hypothetical protein